MRAMLLLPLFLAACTVGPTAPGGPTVFNVEASVRLGQTVRLGNVSVTPLEVVEDSRCPVEVMCVHAGYLRVRTEIRTGRETRTETLELRRGIALEDARSLTFSGAEPGRSQSAAVRLQDYRLTFTLGPGD